MSGLARWHLGPGSNVFKLADEVKGEEGPGASEAAAGATAGRIEPEAIATSGRGGKEAAEASEELPGAGADSWGEVFRRNLFTPCPFILGTSTRKPEVTRVLM